MKPKSEVINISSDSSSEASVSTYDLAQRHRIAYNPSGEGPSEVNVSPDSSEEDEEETMNPTPLAMILPSFTPVSEFLTS